MQRRIETRTRGEFLVERVIERIVWNAAAGAALAVVFLGEQLFIYHFLGAALVFVGILFAARR